MRTLGWLAVIFGAMTSIADPIATAVSPDGRNRIELWDSPLAFEVVRDGVTVVNRTEIGLKVDGKPLAVAGTPRIKCEDRQGKVASPVYKKSSVDLSVRMVRADFGNWSIDLAARDDGVAYRFATKLPGRIRVDAERGGIAIPDPNAHCSFYYGRSIGCEEALPRSAAAKDIVTDDTRENHHVYLPFVYSVGGKHVAVVESDVYDYPIWNFRRTADSASVTLASHFANFPAETFHAAADAKWKTVELPDGGRWVKVRKWSDYLVETEGTRTFPWRGFILADAPSAFCESDLVFALARESKAMDFSWVKPGKVAWDWWNAWDNLGEEKGCTTDGYRRFIDFASENGIEYVILDEGWSEKLNIWKFHPKVDVPEIIRYGREKGVGIILWMAWAQVCGCEARVAREFAELGVKGFKVDFMDRGDAEVERFLWKFADECARHRMLVDYHGAHRPTGMSRAYPNVLNYEGVRGLESTKWYREQYDFLDNDIKQFFLRMTAGPMDYTPGAMDNYAIGKYAGTNVNPGSLGTRVHQLAQLVAYEAPLQMLCDAPTKYERNRECLKFMARVPVVWANTVGLDGDPDSYAAIAREAKDGSWYVAALNNATARTLKLDTKFLGSGKWVAEIFRDAEGAAAKPTDYVHERSRPVAAGGQLDFRMAAGGGLVLRLTRNADFRITDFGARTDGSKCTAAFAQAFAAAERAGGGRVVVPRGKYLSGSIRFQSNCELHLEAGAEICFTQDPQDFLPAVPVSWEGVECVNFCPCLYAYGCTNVAITGEGTIRGFEGEYKNTIWRKWTHQTVTPPNPTFLARRQLYMWGATDFPVEDRQIWKLAEPRTRPHLIHFNRCRNVRLEGVRIRQAPFWTIHLFLCQDVVARGLDVKANGNNNDGIDLEMSRNVLIENCRFDQGDDAIVLKAGRNRDAWRLNTPTENVTIRNCEVLEGHTLLGIGSELSGGIRNVRLENCVGKHIWRVIFIKTNRRRGGFVENITIDGLKLDRAIESLVEINADTLYEWVHYPDMETRLTPIRNLCVKNVTCRETGCVLKLDPDYRLPAENIRIENVKARKVYHADVVKSAKGVTFDGHRLDGLRAEESRTCPGVITLDIPAGHAEIALKGARVLGWSPKGGREMIRMMIKGESEVPGEWSHGGICPCWPWFGGKEVNGAKVIHGFIRNKRFELRRRELKEDRASVTLGYRLKADEEPTFPYAADLEITFTLTAGKLDYAMKTTNLGSVPFAYSEGIHPYFFCILELCDIAGVKERPFKVVDGMDQAFDYSGSAVRLVDRSFWNRTTRITGCGGSKLVVWTPGLVEPPNRNLQADDMPYFACIGPFVPKTAPTELKPGASHELSMSVVLE